MSFLLPNQLYQLTLDIAINFWLTDSYLKALKWNAWEIHLNNFMGDIQISLGSIGGRWKRWCLTNSLTQFMQWYSFSVSFLSKYWFWNLGCHFLSTDAGWVGCHGWGRHHLLNPKHLVVPDFVALSWFTGYVVFLITSFFMNAESGDQFLLNYLKFCPAFLG